MADKIEHDDDNLDGDLGEGPEWSDEFDAERARSLITRLRTDVKAAKATAITDDQAQMLAEYSLLQEAAQTDAERRQAEIETLQATAGQVSTLTAENARLRVAIAKGLTLDHVARLKGETQAELEADADEFLKLIGSQASGMRPNPAQGTSGGGTGPTLDAQIAEAQKNGDVRLSVRLQTMKLRQINS